MRLAYIVFPALLAALVALAIETGPSATVTTVPADDILRLWPEAFPIPKTLRPPANDWRNQVPFEPVLTRPPAVELKPRA